jgi:GGDEF domain-containing protein
MNKDELIQALARDPIYGCYTRPGLELVAWPEIQPRARYIVFADLDNMHGLNDELGYTEVDRRIRQALTSRTTDAFSCGRWYSGDEIIWILTDDPERPAIDPHGFIHRMTETFAEVGLSAMFAAVPVTSPDLNENIKPAMDNVQAQKKNRKA